MLMAHADCGERIVLLYVIHRSVNSERHRRSSCAHRWIQGPPHTSAANTRTSRRVARPRSHDFPRAVQARSCPSGSHQRGSNMHGHLEVRRRAAATIALRLTSLPWGHRWMFDCCRVPGAGLDWSVSHAKAGDRGRSRHVVVLHRGRVWKLEPWQNGKLLSLDELQRYACRPSRGLSPFTRPSQTNSAHIR